MRVPGLGVSDPFAIGAEVYEAPYRAVMRLFYHSRNGTRVVGPWADPGYERPQGGVPPDLDAAFHPAVASSPLSADSTTATGPAARHRVRGGWFDAGDYGQYVPNAAPVWYLVGAALDLAPQRFGDGDLGIPESGNGIPDVLDELEWGLDWLLGMQDPSDGGVWFRLASRTWDDGPPDRITAPRLLAEKTSHATAAFAAACALHARLIRPYRPERADLALAAARRAWGFLTTHPDWPALGQRYKNPPDVRAGDYADADPRDNRLWAAAELYRSTDEAAFRDAFEAALPGLKIDPTAGVSFKDFALAGLWAYLLAEGGGKDHRWVAEARATLAHRQGRVPGLGLAEPPPPARGQSPVPVLSDRVWGQVPAVPTVQAHPGWGAGRSAQGYPHPGAPLSPPRPLAGDGRGQYRLPASRSAGWTQAPGQRGLRRGLPGPAPLHRRPGPAPHVRAHGGGLCPGGDGLRAAAAGGAQRGDRCFAEDQGMR